MCYSKPGPRCYQHATQEVEKHEMRIQKLKDKGLTIKTVAIDNQMLMQTFEDGLITPKQYARAQKVNAKVMGQLRSIHQSLTQAKMDRDATIKGIERLQRKISDTAIDIKSQQQYQIRLRQAQIVFSTNMDAYDQLKNTVNGRQPSRYGTVDGVRELRNHHAFLSASTPQHKRSLVALTHAVETEKRIRLSHLILTSEQAEKIWINPLASREKMLTEYQQVRISLNILEHKIVRAENMLERFGAGSMKKLRKMRDTMDTLYTTKIELANQLRFDS